MKLAKIHLGAALAIAVVGGVAWQAQAGRELVKFPENYASGVHYDTVNRGNIREEIFATRPAIEAVKNGRPIPSGSVITMEDYRDGKLFRYIVMEKRTGWGAEYPENLRNGEWEYQSFNPDRTVNEGERHPMFLLPQVSDVRRLYIHAQPDEERQQLNEGGSMPHVIVKLWPGKSEAQKKKLAEELTRAVTSILHYGDESVSVGIEEVDSRNWTDKV
jgi:4-oxalocrotonate tautomerase family enzyme